MDYTLADLTKAISMVKNVEKKDEYIISFTKEDDGLWYVVYPDWPFDYSHLQMVDGADKLCELLSYDGKHTKVSVIPSKEHKVLQSHDLNERFALIKTKSSLTEGATYQVQLAPFKYNGGPWIWLCPVTLFVLGEYPEYLYIKRFTRQDMLNTKLIELTNSYKLHLLFKRLNVITLDDLLKVPKKEIINAASHNIGKYAELDDFLESLGFCLSA